MAERERKPPAWLESLKWFWGEFRRSTIGLTGLALLLIFAFIAVAYPVIGDVEAIENWFNQEYWSIERLTPELAPPAWINVISPVKYPVTTDASVYKTTLLRIEGLSWNDTLLLEFLRMVEPQAYEKVSKILERIDEAYKAGVISEEQWKAMRQRVFESIRKGITATYGDTIEVVAYVMTFPFDADMPPVDLAVKGTIGPEPEGTMRAGVLILLLRPDGIVVPLAPVEPEAAEAFARIVGAGGCKALTPECKVLVDFEAYMDVTGEEAIKTLSFYSIPPLTGLEEPEVWVFRLSRLHSAIMSEGAITLLNRILYPFTSRLGVTITLESPPRVDRVIFMEITPEALEMKAPIVKGTYQLVFIAYAVYRNTTEASVPIEINVVRVMGAYGLLGTDSRGRDLWQGLLYGVQWALLVGLLASALSVTIGALYGMVSGYFGGIVDTVMNRVAQVVYSLPVLPLLILLSYYIGKSIWIIIGLLVAFGWVGYVFTVRSMALQIRENLYVEAARAIGAGHGRIILRYVLPQVLPYMFASIALGVPGAILAEAGLSFLGLGDPSLVTWGKILHDAQRAGAVLQNAWWWVVPPGLAIALMGMTFVFLGYALDAILNPRLRR